MGASVTPWSGSVALSSASVAPWGGSAALSRASVTPWGRSAAPLRVSVTPYGKYANLNNLDEIVYSVLNIIFDKDHQLTNPGKIFTLQILKHQRINFYEFDQVTGSTNSVTVWRNENAGYQFKLGLLNINEYKLEGIERYRLRDIISSQFKKFKDLG